MTKKICLLFPNYKRGGAETAFDSYIEALSKKYNIYVITNKNFISKIKIDSYIVTSENYFSNACKIIKYIQSISPDIVITFKSHVLLIPLLKYMKLFKSIKFKIVMRESNNVIGYMHKEIHNIFHKFFFWLILKKIPSSLADLVICNSRESSQDFQKFTKKANVMTVYNPLYTDSVIQENSFFDRQYELGFFGRFAEQKNPLDFLTIVLQSKNKLQNKSIMIGSGPDEDRINKFIIENQMSKLIDIVPFQESISDYLRSCKVVILTSSYEGMPNILIEAIENNCNIISYNCKSGPSELSEMSDGRFFKLIDANNIEECVKNIPFLLNHVPSQKEMRQNVLNNFSEKNFLDKFEVIVK